MFWLEHMCAHTYTHPTGSGDSACPDERINLFAPSDRVGAKVIIKHGKRRRQDCIEASVSKEMFGL